MVSIDDLKELTLYKKQFFLPIDPKDKRHGSAIMLMTPSRKSSVTAMTEPYTVNRKYFESYYLEKNIVRFIQNESVISVEDPGEYLFEASLSSQERNELKDSDFGLPDKRKYPLNDQEHVLLAIKFFNYCQKEDKDELAKNILKAIGKKFTDKELANINVGKNNAFRPYWENSEYYKKIHKDDDKNSISESVSSDRENLIENIKKVLKDNNLEAHISANGDWGYENFINGSDTLCLGSFSKETLDKAYEIINDIIPDGYSLSKEDFFTLFINVENPIKISESLEIEYFNEFVNNHAIASLGKKTSPECNVTMSGYPKDIDIIKKYIPNNLVIDCFVIMEKKPPKAVSIVVSNDPTVPENFTKDSVVIYTPHALKSILPNTDYKSYIKYILQLYAVYTLTPKNGLYCKHPGRVMDSIAEPAAIVLSGIASKDILKDQKDPLYVERVFTYIINTYGITEFIRIISSNDINSIFKYSKEFGINTVKNRLYFEQVEIMQEEADTPSIEDPTPDSIKNIQNLATKLKRRIKQHSIYKLNKIARDMQRGNVGTETRGETTLQQIQTGNILNNDSSVSTEQLEYLSGGDYITEGNYVYLFENSDKYDFVLRRALFRDRFTSNKQVLQIYNQIKNEAPFIKYTFVDISRYLNRNLFVDLSYYNESFFRNISDLNDEDKRNTPRIFQTYIELMERLLKDDMLSSYKKKTIFIPILDWRHNHSMKMWMYKEDINPISVIYHMIKYDISSLKRLFGTNDVIFLGGKNYFKLNFSKTDFSNTSNVNKFLMLIKRIITLGYTMEDPDPAGEFSDSPSGIAMDIIDKVETSQNVTIDNVSKLANLKKNVDLIQPSDQQPENEIVSAVKKVPVDVPTGNLSGNITTVPAGNIIKNNKKVPVEVDQKVVNSADSKADSLLPSDTKAANSTSEDDKKDAIVDAIVKAADNANSTDDAMKTLNTDEFKEMILALQNNSENNVRVDRVQASNVVNAQNEFHKKQVAGRSVEELLNENNTKKELPKTALKVASINEDWQNLTFVNFDKDYDLNSDIVKMLDSMQYWTFPIAVKNIDIKDNSTSEDILDLWTIECVDFRNSKFTLRIDIPKFINGSNFLKLRGNEKTLMIQSALLPLIKTGLEECQIIGTGGYNKIFVRKFGSRAGQSLPASSNLIRALNKYIQSHKDIKVVFGNNAKICSKYELPIDYIDLSQVINSIEMNDLKIYFNQDELRNEYEVDDTKGIPIGIEKVYSEKEKKAVETILYFNGKTANTISNMIAMLINAKNPEFAKIYDSIGVSGSRYSYSKASILDKKIPVVLICAYLEGLITTMNKAGINYHFEQKLEKDIKFSDKYDYIRFSDGYLVYEVTYSSSMLMNGIKDHDTESYSLNDINNRSMYIDFFNAYGNFIEDGLENSYDCMLDPITKEILEKCKLPTDYVSVLIYASNLLADNKYTKHIDQAGRRWRRKELIAGYFYKVLSGAYQDYSRSLRNSRKGSKMEVKQSAIIDLILSKDPATSDLSVNNALNDVECANSVTNKGLVGMNVSRGYTINTRGYDDSMLNLLGMDTGFSGNVGINRQATINANIEGGRGFVKTIDGDTDKLSVAAAFTMTEAVTPFGCTHDDPPRTLMTYVQTSKHMIRCDNNDPTLITTGADEAMPYLTSDIFAYKAKKNGQVIELVQEGFGKQNYMVIEYDDGSHEFVNLSEEVKKNSDGGYFVPMKLDTDFAIGKKFKAGEIIAYDKLSFSNSLGESGNLAANIGTLAKIAIINTDEGFEDSAAVTESFSEKIGTSIIQGIETRVDKGSNIFVYKNIGDKVMEGDTLFSYQADFDDDVVNTLLKNLTMNSDQLSELGRTPIKSKYTGIVSDIIIYRTCELDQMSSSLRDFVLKYENKVTDIKTVYDKYGIDPSALPKTGKVPEIGKTKNLEEAVLIIYYIKYSDKLSVGDKIVFYSANKGVIKYIIPKEDEPYTDFRPNEHIDSFMSLSSISGRMTCSSVIFASTSKLMVELDRSIKDIAGIPYDESKL